VSRLGRLLRVDAAFRESLAWYIARGIFWGATACLATIGFGWLVGVLARTVGR
jgi:hypothetical protein